MRDYDEFDEEKDLKAIKPAKSDMTEFGDRLNKSDICNAILFYGSIGALIFCACLRGCQEVKKYAHNGNSSAPQTMHLKPHNCR